MKWTFPYADVPVSLFISIMKFVLEFNIFTANMNSGNALPSKKKK